MSAVSHMRVGQIGPFLLPLSRSARPCQTQKPPTTIRATPPLPLRQMSLPCPSSANRPTRPTAARMAPPMARKVHRMYHLSAPGLLRQAGGLERVRQRREGLDLKDPSVAYGPHAEVPLDNRNLGVLADGGHAQGDNHCAANILELLGLEADLLKRLIERVEVALDSGLSTIGVWLR